MIGTRGIFLVLLLSMLSITVIKGKENYDSIILPPDPLGPDAPECTSYNTLCHLAYNISEKGSAQVFHSHSQICRCPGDLKCPTEWFEMENSLVKSFKSSGEEMQVKVSYCQLKQPERRCLQNEPAIILRGRGPFHFEVVQDFKCKCHRPMYAHQSWQDGPYDYVEYSCGKPRCGVNRHPEKKCTKISYIEEGNYFHEYLCRCKWFEECTGGLLPTASKLTTDRHCQSVYHNDYRRKWHSRKRRKISNKSRRTIKAT